MALSPSVFCKIVVLLSYNRFRLIPPLKSAFYSKGRQLLLPALSEKECFLRMFML